MKRLNKLNIYESFAAFGSNANGIRQSRRYIGTEESSRDAQRRRKFHITCRGYGACSSRSRMDRILSAAAVCVCVAVEIGVTAGERRQKTADGATVTAI